MTIQKCRTCGILKVLISELLTTTRLKQEFTTEVNKLIENICVIEEYYFVNNYSITPTMEVVKRRRNNSEKQLCFGNNFFQLESHENEHNSVSFQTLYPTINSNKYFKPLKPF